MTQGIPQLREELQARVDKEYGHEDRRVLITSGTSGALVTAMLALVDPGDEVIFFDPYFVMYPALVKMVGGKCLMIDTYPDFRIDPEKVAAAITPKDETHSAQQSGQPYRSRRAARRSRSSREVGR